ncbi:MAG: DUF2493 domain-containing protein [Longimicrobiales bacterium]
MVCGDRNWTDREAVRARLGLLQDQPGLSAVIHGAARGADRFAGEWAHDHDVPEAAYPADWANLGRRAGIVRNARMLAQGKPNAVLAFHDNIAASRGTKKMVDRALRAGLPVTVWTHKGSILLSPYLANWTRDVAKTIARRFEGSKET